MTIAASGVQKKLELVKVLKALKAKGFHYQVFGDSKADMIEVRLNQSDYHYWIIRCFADGEDLFCSWEIEGMNPNEYFPISLLDQADYLMTVKFIETRIGE